MILIPSVYIFRAKNYVKVGESNNPKRRKEQLQIGCPHRLETEDIIWFKAKDKAQRVEEEIHKKLKDYHHRGEWFKINKNKLEELVKNLPNGLDRGQVRRQSPRKKYDGVILSEGEKEKLNEVVNNLPQ